MKKHRLSIGTIVLLLFIISVVIIKSSGIVSGKGLDNLYPNRFTEAEAINRLTKDHPEFPSKAGSFIETAKLPGGEPEAVADVSYNTEIKLVQRGKYIVTFTKDWNTNVNGEDVIVCWKYEITEDNTTLLESRNNEYLLNIIK